MSASKLRIYWRMQLAAHYMQKRTDRELQSRTKITAAQTGVLTVIANGSNVLQKQVALELGLNEAAVTAMVKRLVALKYIRRQKSPRDARAYILTLTKLGKEAQKSARGPFSKINTVIEETLSPSEINKLANYLDRLSHALKR